MGIGNRRSETSFHKDHYENLYAVVSGEKQFLLLPPTDVHRLYPTARYSYCEESGEFSLELEERLREVPCCSVDLYPVASDQEEQMISQILQWSGAICVYCEGWRHALRAEVLLPLHVEYCTNG